MSSPCASGGPAKDSTPATRCKPPAVTPSRIKPGFPTRTETSGKCSSCSKTIFPRREARVSAPAAQQRPQASSTLHDEMTAQLVTIEKAPPACLDDVLEILSQANLPH